MAARAATAAFGSLALASATYLTVNGASPRLVRADSGGRGLSTGMETVMDGAVFYTTRGGIARAPTSTSAPRIASTPTEHFLDQLPDGTMVVVNRQ